MKAAAIQGLVGAAILAAGVAVVDWRIGISTFGAVIFLDYLIGQLRRERR